jgi:hypothetical protein
LISSATARREAVAVQDGSQECREGAHLCQEKGEIVLGLEVEAKVAILRSDSDELGGGTEVEQGSVERKGRLLTIVCVSECCCPAVAERERRGPTCNFHFQLRAWREREKVDSESSHYSSQLARVIRYDHSLQPHSLYAHSRTTLSPPLPFLPSLFLQLPLHQLTLSPPLSPLGQPHTPSHSHKHTLLHPPQPSLVPLYVSPPSSRSLDLHSPLPSRAEPAKMVANKLNEQKRQHRCAPFPLYELKQSCRSTFESSGARVGEAEGRAAALEGKQLPSTIEVMERGRRDGRARADAVPPLFSLDSDQLAPFHLNAASQTPPFRLKTSH